MQPDTGTISLAGAEVRIDAPRTAHRLGIQTAFQEMTLVDDLSVLDNMLLPYGPVGPFGTIRRRQAHDLVLCWRVRRITTGFAAPVTS